MVDDVVDGFLAVDETPCSQCFVNCSIAYDDSDVSVCEVVRFEQFLVWSFDVWVGEGVHAANFMIH